MAVAHEKTSLRDLSLLELEALAAAKGEKPYRGKQLAEWLYKKTACDWAEIKNLPLAFLQRLQKKHLLCSLELVSKFQSAIDPSVKYLLKTQDGNLVETVYIPQGPRRTQCLSTQIGCKMGCRFCASGAAGFVRSLSCGEILDQIAFVAKDQGRLPTNLVYMGMGEPFDNYDAVVKSIRIANAPWAFEIGQRRITVSTVGIVPGIQKFANEDMNQIKLSVSLHSPDDAVRTRLIPANKKYNVGEILKVLTRCASSFKRQMTFEYLLIEGVTDRDEDARSLAEIASELAVKINLIPYNPGSAVSEFKRPSQSAIMAFQRKLENKNVRTTVRFSAGQDIAAACGQLRLQAVQK